MSDQVGNPEDRFSHNETHFIRMCIFKYEDFTDEASIDFYKKLLSKQKLAIGNGGHLMWIDKENLSVKVAFGFFAFLRLQMRRFARSVGCP